MTPGRRIGIIYAKELVELLRDRRTLIAMIVVPIALYPLLIVGSVHLLSIRGGERKLTPIVIAVPDASAPAELADTGAFVEWAVQRARENIRHDPELSDADRAERLESLEQFSIHYVPDVRAAVADGADVVGVELRRESPDGAPLQQLVVTAYYDKAEVQSESALQRVVEMLEVVARQEQDRILRQLKVSPVVLEPMRIVPTNVATPKKVGGMVLGTIVPLVLVLMTITGAIYPAIDLTAGERERGTLETLIACPVPSVELLTGKYLVVATVAMLGAALNLASVGATLYFGGFTDLLSRDGDTELPLGVLPIILVALVPFALLFAAVMVAVCSYARTFKEAQNYIVPVILAALIPGGIAALPGTEFTHLTAIVPVMNMVLMARELLLGNYDWTAIALVLLSTSLYASASVIIASRVFSTEAVVFADSTSIRAMFHRGHMQPSALPSISLVLLVGALLYPAWMFVQFAIQPDADETLLHTFIAVAEYMPAMLVLIPVLILVYFKIDLHHTFALRRPQARFLLAAGLIGVAAWVPAHELFVLQSRFIPIPAQVIESNAQLFAAFADCSLLVPLLLIALLPAVCEELFFRGFLFGGVSSAAGKWTTIITTACIFAVFHILLIKFPITAALGVLLGYLRWQSRSLAPSILTHLLHNASAVMLVFVPQYPNWLGLGGRGVTDHLPASLIIIATALVIAGILLARNPARPAATRESGRPSDSRNLPRSTTQL